MTDASRHQNVTPHRNLPALDLVVIAVVVIAVHVSSASADVIKLANGNEIQGEIVNENDREIVVKFPGGVMQIRRKDVRDIHRQDRKQYLLEEAAKQLRRRSFENAIRSYRELYGEDPSSDRAREGLREAKLGLATSWRQIGRFDEARSLLEELVADGPENRSAREQLRILEETLSQADAEESKAIEELGQGALDSGIWRLQQLYDGFPDRRESIGKQLSRALVLKGNALIGTQNWKPAAERYLVALTIDPETLSLVKQNFVAAQTMVLKNLTEAGEFPAVEKAARAGLDVDPSSDAMRFFLGLAQEGQDRPRAAAEEYLAITGGRPPVNLARSVHELRKRAERKLRGEDEGPATSAQTTRTASREYRTVSSRHFTLTSTNSEAARKVISVAELMYARLSRELKCATHLRTKIDIHLFSTKDEYLKGTGLDSWTGGVHQIVNRRGSLSQHRILCYEGQHGILTEVLPHEIGHVMLSHRLNHQKLIPLWTNEGYAVRAQSNFLHERYRRIIAQETKLKRLIPFEELTGKTEYPESGVSLFYAQAHSLTEFLIASKGLDTFVGFVSSLATNAEIDEALRRFYGIQGLHALENLWIAWFEKRAT